MTGIQPHWHRLDRCLTPSAWVLCLALAVGMSPAYAGFAPHTDILMADGQFREIEGIKVGDQVTGVSGTRNRVVGIDRSLLTAGLYALDETALFMTPDHPLLTVSGWKSFSPKSSAKLVPGLVVDRFQQGDVLLTLTSTKPAVVLSYKRLAKIKIGNPLHPVYVYDLHLDGDHTYYANGYVAHNSEKGDKGDDGDKGDNKSGDSGDSDGPSGSRGHGSSDGESSDAGSSGSSGSGSSGGNSGGSSGQSAGGQETGGHEGATGGSQGDSGGQESASGDSAGDSGGGGSDGGGSDGGGSDGGGSDGGGSGGDNGSGGRGEHADEQSQQAEITGGGRKTDVSGATPASNLQESEPINTMGESGAKPSGLSVQFRSSGRFDGTGLGNRRGDGRTIDLIVELPEGTRELSQDEERDLLQKRWQGTLQ